MARTKAQQQDQEPKADDAKEHEPEAQQPVANEPSADATANDAAASTDAATPPPPGDEPDDEPAGDRSVLILRDETVGDVDFKPGDTPTLPAADVDYLIERGAADDNPKAVAAARKARGGDAEAERVIE